MTTYMARSFGGNLSKAHRSRNSKRAALLAAAVAPVMALSFAHPALATQKTFSTVPANTSWLTAANWTPARLPCF